MIRSQVSVPALRDVDLCAVTVAWKDDLDSLIVKGFTM